MQNVPLFLTDSAKGAERGVYLGRPRFSSVVRKFIVKIKVKKAMKKAAKMSESSESDSEHYTSDEEVNTTYILKYLRLITF